MSGCSIIVLAGGLGSRFGGDKPFAPVGPNGETILEFNLSTAIRAGVTRVAMVVPPGRGDEIDAYVRSRVPAEIEVVCVEQDKAQPYSDMATPERERPWGTAHAAAIGMAAVAGPWIIVNADDWYGPGCCDALVPAVAAAADGVHLVTWPLGATLSEHGSVNRGVCENDQDGRLQAITEACGIDGSELIGTAPDGSSMQLSLDTPVSLNLWAIGSEVGVWFCAEVRSAIAGQDADPKVEVYLPGVLSDGMRAGHYAITSHATGEQWCGMTYSDDLPMVRQRLADAVASGHYPQPLW
ncbi:MAG: NTP transferase domain-containing protein [Planctomycetota bacterium]